MLSLSKQRHFAAKGCVLTFWTEAAQGLSFGGSHVGQTQGALIEILVGEQVGQTHGGGVVGYVRAELLRDTRRTIINIYQHLSKLVLLCFTRTCKTVESSLLKKFYRHQKQNS